LGREGRRRGGKWRRRERRRFINKLSFLFFVSLFLFLGSAHGSGRPFPILNFLGKS
jgi:hypothetical protein